MTKEAVECPAEGWLAHTNVGILPTDTSAGTRKIVATIKHVYTMAVAGSKLHQQAMTMRPGYDVAYAYYNARDFAPVLMAYYVAHGVKVDTVDLDQDTLDFVRRAYKNADA